jgi:hypothetical protein
MTSTMRSSFPPPSRRKLTKRSTSSGQRSFAGTRRNGGPSKPTCATPTRMGWQRSPRGRNTACGMNMPRCAGQGRTARLGTQRPLPEQRKHRGSAKFIESRAEAHARITRLSPDFDPDFSAKVRRQTMRSFSTRPPVEPPAMAAKGHLAARDSAHRGATGAGSVSHRERTVCREPCACGMAH